jgi:nucleotide-binding universal stress UspA family protein
MHHIENILVPTDFSVGSRRAAEFACAMAKVLGAHVTLLHVLHLPTPEYGDAVYATVVDRIPSILRSCQAALEAEAAAMNETGAQTATLLRQGKPAHEIVDVARDQKIDLVVIATHGRGGLARGLLGSVTEKVVRLSPVPVLTLHAFREGDEAVRANFR